MRRRICSRGKEEEEEEGAKRQQGHWQKQRRRGRGREVSFSILIFSCKKCHFLFSARDMGSGGHRQLKANILLVLSEGEKEKEKLLLGQEGDQEEEIAPRPKASREMTKMLLTSPGLLVVRREKNAGKAGVAN